MSKASSLTSCWATASLGRPADISPQERSALGDHLSLCGALRGPLHGLWVGAGEAQRMLAGRVVTSVLVIAVLVGGTGLLL